MCKTMRCYSHLQMDQSKSTCYSTTVCTTCSDLILTASLFMILTPFLKNTSDTIKSVMNTETVTQTVDLGKDKEPFHNNTIYYLDLCVCGYISHEYHPPMTNNEHSFEQSRIKHNKTKLSVWSEG